MKQIDGLKAKNVGLSLIVVISMLISGMAILAAPVTIAQDTLGGEYGGDLRVALQGQPNSLNPMATTLNEPAMQVIDLLYEPLGRIDASTLELKPWLASSWTVDATNESIVSVVLKQGVKWHDGTEVTLEDVEFSLSSVDYISSMELNPDTNTIIFNLVEPDARFFSQAMAMKIVPDGFTLDSDPIIGCGPYMLESSDDDSTVLIAFEDHFVGRPFLDSVIFTYYPYSTEDFSEDYPYTDNFVEDPRFSGSYRASHDIIQGELDFIGWGLSTNETTGIVEVNGNDTTLVLNSNITVTGSNGFNSWYLGFNNAPGHIFNDMAVRKAITYGINKNALTQYDISGGLIQTESVVSKFNLPWYNSSITPYSYDMAMALAILDDAGYKDYNSDGYREMPDGSTFNLTILGPPMADVTPFTMSTNIITWFQNLGFNVNLVSDTNDVHMTKIIADDFDLYLADSKGGIDPQFMYNIYHSEATTTNLLNFAGTYSEVNVPLIEFFTNESWTHKLNFTNVVDPVYVYHNGTLISNSSWEMDYDTGLFTLDNSFILDYANDTLNITYSYLPFDHYIELAGSQMEPEDRAKYIKDAQAVISDMCPSVPMFTYKVNHAYFAGSFVGWVKTLGGLGNYWTYTNLKNQLVGDLEITVSSFKQSLSQGEVTDLYIRVQDKDGENIPGATPVCSGEGTFGVPEYDDAGQQFTVEYTAPETQVSKTITLSVMAYVSGYTSASDQMDITIHPKVNNFVVEIVRGDTSLASGNTTDISVIVTDKDTSTAISGATVVLSLTPIGLGGELADLTGTTNAGGEFLTSFTSNNVTVDTTFRITAYVSMEGYVDAEQSTSISVARDPTIVMEDADTGFLGLPAPSFLVVLVLLATMSMIYAAYRRRE